VKPCMKTKVAYIISDIDKAIAFEWIAEYLDQEKFQLYFLLITKDQSDLQRYLEARGTFVKHIGYSGKKDLFTVWRKVYAALKQIEPDCVHCHLQMANLTGLTAAKFAGVRKRIYTRHHSTLHHIYHKKGVLVDRLINAISTKIVAISPVVETVLVKMEKVPERKVVLIPHGFELAEFEGVEPDRIASFRARHNLLGKSPVVGVISRYTEWKGIQHIIPAFKQLRGTYPSACLLLLNARGDYKGAIEKLLKLLPSDSYREIEFENDIAAAYKTMDVFVHVPIDDHSEAFGQIYVEALAAGIPSVFTISGIAKEFVKDQENAFVVPYKNEQAIGDAIMKIVTDVELSASLSKRGRDDVKRLFGVDKMIKALQNLYEGQAC
jgi:glycosyltransferase involved in cell wall biosynthesis